MLRHRLRFLPHLEPKFPCQNAELIIRPLLRKENYFFFVALVYSLETTDQLATLKNAST